MRVGHMILLLGLLPATARAQGMVWSCLLDDSGSCSQSTRVDLPLAGTWIGDYDATTNPAGTRTIPGLFGGSGNNAIPFSGLVRTDAVISDSVPAGSFTARFDPASGRLCMAELDLDLLDGRTGTLTTNLVITFGSFRTISPNSTFFGVSNLSVPYGDGTLTTARAVQTLDAQTQATVAAEGGWNFTLDVPVNLLAVGQTQGMPFESTSVALLRLQGHLAMVDGQLVLTGSSQDAQQAPVPAPPPFTGVPLALPTVLPPGSTANLLMSGTFSDGTQASTFSATVRGVGDPACEGDLDGSGTCDAADIGSLLTAFGDCSGLCRTDLDGDDAVTAADLGALLVRFGPCP